MFKKMFLSLCLVSLTCSGAIAQESSDKPDSPEVSAERMKLSEEAFRLAGIDKELKVIAGKQLKMFYFARRMSNLAVSKTEEEKKKRDRVAKALNDVFKNDIDIMDEVKPILVKSFAKVYTEKELKQMIDFYKSPTGKKMVSQSPKMTDIIYKRTLTEVAPKLDKALKLAIKEEVLDKRNAEKTE